MRRSRLARRLAGLACAMACLCGCEGNARRPQVVPTGIRPRPEVGAGFLTGQVRFDPLVFPDLADPPYPPTVVELFLGGERIAADTLPDSTRTFVFPRLHAGHYTVEVDAHLLRRTSRGPVRVVDSPVDAGDVTLPADPLEGVSQIHLFGDFNGFPELDFPDSTRMDQTALGIWVHPNLDPGMRAQFLEPGNYAFRFVTDLDIHNSTDFGAIRDEVFEVPVVNAPTRQVRGAGTNLKIRIATPARYEFRLDERRHTFSVQAVPDDGPIASRRARR